MRAPGLWAKLGWPWPEPGSRSQDGQDAHSTEELLSPMPNPSPTVSTGSEPRLTKGSENVRLPTSSGNF